MIIGDYKIIVRIIVKNIGIFKDGDMVIEGVEFEKMFDEELENFVEKILVYVRVFFEYKIRIVNVW